MSILKYLTEHAPISARSATFIPFDFDNDHIDGDRWISKGCNEQPTNDELENNKQDELEQLLDRLRELIINKDDQSVPTTANYDMEDEEADNEFGISDEPMNDDVAAHIDDFGDERDSEEQDGTRRFVKNAHLVYKKRAPDGLFEELWIFNIGKDTPNDEYQIRRDILGSTDIEPPETTSKDGTQSYSTWTAGNAQMLHIHGLPN